VDGWGVERDVEAVFYALEDCGLVDIMVARVDYACGFRPALLGCADGGPEDSFAAASCIAAGMLASMHSYANFLKPTRRGGRSRLCHPIRCPPS
jgi:hypothetical protein